MCGRYEYQVNDPLLAHFYGKLGQDSQVSVGTVYPGQDVLCLGLDPQAKVRVAAMRWGFDGFKKKQLLINARSETINDKLAFAQAFRYRRCIFPMSAFYEWSADKTRFLFSASEVLFVGGCYQVIPQAQGQVQAQAILMTQPADQIVGRVHQRMPYLIHKEDLRSWLGDWHYASNYQGQSPELAMQKDSPDQLSHLVTLDLE
ncbi:MULTISPECIES: SOS response-associated peptidase [Aerococcus]|uniref:Abasic site processing protein n=1 Tax=Aerococcus sanguinicola TaxID=119206 RepID=A0A5N1GNK0_9LACT|nr:MULTISPECIES: SOS response-associated peptidase family protein [Aerococcus]KAA9302372.1 SOS response-associated peptidase [Aerococcus sanguinicola]MDK6369744.1 SOS response-associated peptidase family protein [Aerococcus sp. UMB9870]MDK6680384.1 SOS response-associated peptidase family protein [Aerococcus sp. UMB8608]MDK6687119.1 SOS response-associated peptidase family protein [Aerococcus sp. UMB8623]MDK6940338.1 SOS response-associated peptidase family protein [Aerococcus sp. UMB8487]